MSTEPTFTEFASALEGGGVLLSSELYDEFLADFENPHGASKEFIAALPHPVSTDQESCPVCLQPTAAILTEEEYALASEHFFGDTAALGLRSLPCDAGHVLCARCASAWLRINNSCPLCRAVLDPHAPVPAIEEQRRTERMLAFFHELFGRPGGAGGAGGGGGVPAGAPAAATAPPKPSFSGMYS